MTKQIDLIDSPLVEIDLFDSFQHYHLTIDSQDISLINIESYNKTNPAFKSVLFYLKDGETIPSYDKFIHKYSLSVSDALEHTTSQLINLIISQRTNKITHKTMYESINQEINKISRFELDLLQYFLKRGFSLQKSSEIIRTNIGTLYNKIVLNELFLVQFPDISVVQHSLIESIINEIPLKEDLLQIINSLNFYDYILRNYMQSYSTTFLKICYIILKGNQICVENDDHFNIITSIIENYVTRTNIDELEIDIILQNTTINNITLFQKFRFQKLREIFVKKIPKVKFESSSQIYSYFINKFNSSQNAYDSVEEKMIKLDNWFQIYNYYCFYTRFNPDDLTSNFITSDHIKNKIDHLRDTEIFKFWMQNDPLKINFDHTVKVLTNVFSNSNPNEILLGQLQYLKENSLEVLYQNLWYSRLSLFIVDNFYEIETSTIMEFLQLTLPQEVNYLTPDILILQLLNCLIEQETLSAEELYYLQNYLDLEIIDYSKDTIAELIYSINQLERSPKMLIHQQDGTILQYDELTVTEGNSITMRTPEILSISEEIIGIMPAEDLMDYLYLFFQYHHLTRFSHDMNNEKKYNELTNLQAYIHKFGKYMNQFTKLRHKNRWNVDDIQIEFALIDTLVDESPEFAYSKLMDLKSVLENHDVPDSDWKRFDQLRLELNNILGVEQTI